MINANLIGETISSSSEDAFSLYEKSAFGEKIDNKIEYSFSEALFLIKENKMKVFYNLKEMSFDDLLKKIKRIDKSIENKFLVFYDLRKKGLIAKTALKFGADYRVYEKGKRPEDGHSKWLLFIVKENSVIDWKDFAAKNRVAHSTNKKLLVALIDEEKGVSYYEIDWIRL